MKLPEEYQQGKYPLINKRCNDCVYLTLEEEQPKECITCGAKHSNFKPNKL